MALVASSVSYKDAAGLARLLKTLLDDVSAIHTQAALLYDHLNNPLTIDVGGGVGALKIAPVTAIQAIGFDAHDGTTSADNRPVRLGAQAKSALSGLTLVSADDISGLMADLDGALLTRSNASLADIVTGYASNTDGNSTEVLAAGATGIKHYLEWVILVNTHATQFAYVEMKDGTSAKCAIPVPPVGGAIFTPPRPIPGTAATAWNFDPSAATTTIICSVGGFKSKI